MKKYQVAIKIYEVSERDEYACGRTPNDDEIEIDRWYFLPFGRLEDATNRMYDMIHKGTR
jgi:hypothetical protein